MTSVPPTLPREPMTTLATEPIDLAGVPLRVDPGGAIRVGASRISLDQVVMLYENGMTPEDMVRAYDTLALADVHAVIDYYLRNRDEVRAYLQRRDAEAAILQTRIETACPPVTRSELTTRRDVEETAHAAAGQ